MEKKSKTIGTVRERERERESFNLKKAGKTAQKSCAYLRYKDRLCRIVCLFFVPDSS